MITKEEIINIMEEKFKNIYDILDDSDIDWIFENYENNDESNKFDEIYERLLYIIRNSNFIKTLDEAFEVIKKFDPKLNSLNLLVKFDEIDFSTNVPPTIQIAEYLYKNYLEDLAYELYKHLKSYR